MRRQRAEARTGDNHPMTAPPRFASLEEYRARRGDVGFWLPHLAEILGRHGLNDGSREPEAGFNPTYPTFLFGDFVVKLFGYSEWWRRSVEAESAANALVAADPAIVAPRVLAEGQLFDDGDASWPYLVTTRVSGCSWRDADLSPNQKLSLAAELGRQVRRIHALEPSGVARHEDWSPPPVAEAAARRSLPPHLVAQAEEYVARLGPPDPLFVHADLCGMHAFVENGRLSGIIDWGDAIVADRHLELIQIYRDTLDCDKALFRVFLEACDWPVDEDFPRKALGHALHRQAVGLAQHHGMDVFEPIAARFPLRDIATLDDLAIELFAV